MPRPSHTRIAVGALVGVALYFSVIGVVGALLAWSGTGEGVVVSSWSVSRGVDAGLGVLVAGVALLIGAAVVVSRGTRHAALLAGGLVLLASIAHLVYGAMLPVSAGDAGAAVASRSSTFYGVWLVALALGVALTRPAAQRPHRAVTDIDPRSA